MQLPGDEAPTDELVVPIDDRPIYGSAPRLFPDQTVFLVASGPSLRAVDLSVLKPFPVITVNLTFKLCPWAPVTYWTDWRFWDWYRSEISQFKGMIFSGCPQDVRMGERGVRLKLSGPEGLDPDPSRLRHGNNSGYAAINLALHFGARRLVLVGYDMRQGEDGEMHWHSDHPARTKPHVFAAMIANYKTLPKALKREFPGAVIVNATEGSALDMFERVKLEDEVCRCSETEVGSRRFESDRAP